MEIELTDAQYDEALARGRDRLSKPYATQAMYNAEDQSLTVSFSTSLSFTFDPTKVDILKGVPEKVLAKPFVTPGGDGLIFGDDEDVDHFAVSLPGLLATLMPAAVWETKFNAQTGAGTAGPRTERGTSPILRKDDGPKRTKVRTKEKLTGHADLMARLTQLIDDFCLLHLPSSSSAKLHSESQGLTYLHGFLSSFAPDLDIQKNKILNEEHSIRADILVKSGSEILIIDLKLYSGRRKFEKDLSHMRSNLRRGGFKNGILLLLPDHSTKMKKIEPPLDNSDTRLLVLSPA